jgi:hypothetical protein
LHRSGYFGWPCLSSLKTPSNSLLLIDSWRLLSGVVKLSGGELHPMVFVISLHNLLWDLLSALASVSRSPSTITTSWSTSICESLIWSPKSNLLRSSCQIRQVQLLLTPQLMHKFQAN